MNDESLDLLDLDDGASIDALPDATPFVAAPRPKKPWLLLALGVVIIILSTYIIIRTVSSDSSSSIDVDLDAPAVIVDDAVVVAPDNVMPPAAPVAMPPAPQLQPVAQPQPVPPQPVAQPVQTPGVPVRVVDDRKEVVFNPDAPVAQPAPAAKPVAKPKTNATKSAPKSAPAKPVQKTATAGGWYVQFGSYSTRALAENGERQLRNAHRGLFEGKQFVILAAQTKGVTTYRLRVAFSNASDANGFCRNAKSDGLDCYVAK